MSKEFRFLGIVATFTTPEEEAALETYEQKLYNKLQDAHRKVLL